MSNIIDPVVGTISAVGVSSTFTPTPNASFSVQLSGSFTGALFHMTMSIAGGAQTLMNDQYGNVVQLIAPGGTQFVELPYVAPGTTVLPTYQLSCAAIGAGSAVYMFSQ
jgi:hypothetical protein